MVQSSLCFCPAGSIIHLLDLDVYPKLGNNEIRFQRYPTCSGVVKVIKNISIMLYIIVNTEARYQKLLWSEEPWRTTLG
jgi:hypothetical protein